MKAAPPIKDFHARVNAPGRALSEAKHHVSPTFSSTVSPRNSCSFSMVVGCSATTELSSLTASSTTRRLGDFFLSRMAVLKSFFLLASAAAAAAWGSEGPASSAIALDLAR